MMSDRRSSPTTLMRVLTHITSNSHAVRLELASAIDAAVVEAAARPAVARRWIAAPYAPPDKTTGFNQVVIVLKPELLQSPLRTARRALLLRVFELLDAANLHIHATAIASASWLRENQFVYRNYPRLNRVAREGARVLGDSERALINDRYPNAIVVSAIEFLESHPEISIGALDVLCRNTLTEKLGTGAYATRIVAGSQEWIVLNAFHPRQIRHFESPGGSAVALECRTARHWQEIREIVGDIDPIAASPSTLRGALYATAEQYGLARPCIAENGIHLSPGAMDAMALCSLMLVAETSYLEGLRRTQAGMLLVAKGLTSPDLAVLERLRDEAGAEAAPLQQTTEWMDAEAATEIIAHEYRSRTMAHQTKMLDQ
jgi:hypothetical protein